MSNQLGDAVIQILIKDMQFAQKAAQAMDLIALRARQTASKVNAALGKKQAASITASTAAIAASGKRAAATAAQQTAQIKAQTRAIQANAAASAKSVAANAAVNAVKQKSAAVNNAIRSKTIAANAAASQKLNSMKAAKALSINLNQKKFSQQASQIAARHAQMMSQMQAKSDLLIRLRRQRDASKQSEGGSGGFLQSAGAMATGQLVANGLSMAVASAKDLVTQGVMYNAEIERMTTGFTQMLGSQLRAKALLAETRKYAAVTPFEMPDITQMAVKLLATKKIAESEVMPVIKKLGDAAAGSANGFQSLPHITKAITDMLGKGVIHAQEMNQLSEAGIPAWQMLAESMGVSEAAARKMSEEGKVGMSEIMGLIDKLGTRYKGMAEAQSKTMLGMMSTLKDNIGMALGDAFKPVFEGAKKAMTFAIKMMDGKKFESFITGVQSGMATVMSVIEQIVSSPLAMFIAKVAAISGGILAAVGAASLLSGVIGSITTVLAPLVIPITAAIAGMTLLSTLVQRAFDSPQAKEFGRIITEIKTNVLEIGRNVYRAIIPAFKSAGDMMNGIFGNTGTIQSGFNRFIGGVLNRLKSMVDFMSILSTDWGKAWEYLQAKAAAVAITIWEEFKYTLNERIPFAVAAMVDASIAGFSALVNNGQKIFSAFGTLIINIFDKVVTTIKNGFEAAMKIIEVRLKAAAAAWEDVKSGKLGDAVQKVVDGEGAARQLGEEFIGKAIADLSQPISVFSQEMKSVTSDIGKNTIAAFNSTMSAMPPRVASTMERIAHNFADKMLGEMRQKRDQERFADKTGEFLKKLLGGAKNGIGQAGSTAMGWLDQAKARFNEFAAMFNQPKDEKKPGKTEFVGVEQMNRRLQESLSGNDEKKDRKALVKATLDVKAETKKVGTEVGAAVASGTRATVDAIKGLSKSIGFGD